MINTDETKSKQIDYYYLNAFDSGHSYHFHSGQIRIVVVTHGGKFGDEKIVSSVVRRGVLFDVGKPDELKQNPIHQNIVAENRTTDRAKIEADVPIAWPVFANWVRTIRAVSARFAGSFRRTSSAFERDTRPEADPWLP